MNPYELLAREVVALEKRGTPHPTVLLDSVSELANSLRDELRERPALAKTLALKLAASALLLAQCAELREERQMTRTGGQK